MPDTPQVEPFDDAVRISEVLALPEVARAGTRVLAGADALDRPIRWVHVAETEDVADLLLGGELILTTGISMRPGPEAAGRWIGGLAREGVAGVIVELGPGLPRIAAAAVGAARDAGMPLVSLERPVRFVAVTEEIHGRIVNRQLTALRRAEAMERRLTGLLQAGEGVHAVVEVAAAHVGAPVALVLGDGSTLHAAGGAASAGAGGEGAVDVAAEGPLEGARLVRVPADRPLDLAERAMLERAAGLIAIVAARAHQERVLGLRERGALLAGLMDGAVAPETAARRAAELGMRPPWRLVAFAARLARREGDPPDAAVEAWASLEQRVRPALAHAGGGMVGTRSGHGDLLGVVSARGGGSREAVAARVAEALREGDAGAPAVTVAVGAVAEAWDGLAEALGDAVDALDDPAPPEGWIDASRPSLPRLLAGLGADPRLRSFVRRRLGPLDDGTARARMLRETAAALCAAGGRRADAARSLGIARQSLYGRIEALEDVLGLDLSDPVALTELHVAILAREAGAARRG
ncbi:MAG: PucR family transcriptional regulator ligand-binding domain-containing protein [Thermoleophilia bacterium]